jgi:hypothetical protein
MRIAKEEIATKIDVPGAKARQTAAFGDASGYGTMAGEYFSLGAGTDIAPLLQGLEGDGCQAPHWGYIISGAVVVTYTDGAEEKCATNDVFFWPPGHTVRVAEDAEVVLFSPLAEHLHVLDHMIAKMAGG